MEQNQVQNWYTDDRIIKFNFYKKNACKGSLSNFPEVCHLSELFSYDSLNKQITLCKIEAIKKYMLGPWGKIIIHIK